MSSYYDRKKNKNSKFHFMFRKKEIIYSIWYNTENHGICSRKVFEGTLPECNKFCKENNIKLKRTY